MKAKRLILIGLDGAIPEMIRRFRQELPNIDRLLSKGAFAAARPSPCCDTPTNWTTIATGAWTGTHGITSFFAHLPDTDLTQEYWTFASGLCRAEYIWQAAERAGKRSILINYPVGWPPTLKDGIVIGGDGLTSEQWNIAGAVCYYTEETAVEGAAHITRESSQTDQIENSTPLTAGLRGPARRIALSDAQGWSNLPISHSPILTTSLELEAGARMVWTAAGWRPDHHQPNSDKQRLLTLYVAIVDSSGRGYNRVLVTENKDCADVMADLAVGNWSDWLEVSIGETVPNQGTFRLKLLELSPDGNRIRLYRTPIGELSGWAYPESVASEVCRHVGPFIEGLELYGEQGLHYNWFDIETNHWFLDYQALYLADVSSYLARENDWDLLFVQIHSQDGVNHQHLAHIDPSSSKYDETSAEEIWEIFRRSYKAVDTMIGRIVDSCADEETVVAIVSDHGAVATDKYIWIAGCLIRAGLMHYTPTANPGHFQIDLSRTRAMPTNVNYIWVNLRGREPNGIVEPGAEYEAVRDGVIEALLGLRDPESGECPIALIERKENLRHLGQWGDRVGDIVYFLKPGYTDFSVALSEVNLTDFPFSDPHRLLVGGDFGPAFMHHGIHHSHLPDATSYCASNRAIFILSGPGVKENIELEKEINLVDIAPTFCHLLDIPAPAQSEGEILREMLIEE